MKPAEALHRKAQASPNSAGSPTRPVGFDWPRLARISSNGDVLPPRLVFDARTQPVGQKRAGQQTVDRHVVFGDLPRDAGAERGEAGAGAVAHAEIGDRRLHRARGDVDDAAEFARAHAVDRRLDQHDRRQHVGVERLLPVLDRPFAEIAMRRAAAIIDEDVGVGASGERRGAAGFGRDVAGNRRHLGAGFLADLLGGLFEGLGGARGNRQLDAGSPQGHRTGPAQPFARRADQGLAAANSQIQHGILRCDLGFIL